MEVSTASLEARKGDVCKFSAWSYPLKGDANETMTMALYCSSRMAVVGSNRLPWTLLSWFRCHSGSGTYAGAETESNIRTSGFGKEVKYEH
jgi:hypothetical protein